VPENQPPIYRITIEVDVAARDRDTALQIAAEYLDDLCNDPDNIAGSAQVSDEPIEDELVGVA
jgi:hypothetical protein